MPEFPQHLCPEGGLGASLRNQNAKDLWGLRPHTFFRRDTKTPCMHRSFTPSGRRPMAIQCPKTSAPHIFHNLIAQHRPPDPSIRTACLRKFKIVCFAQFAWDGLLDYYNFIGRRLYEITHQAFNVIFMYCRPSPLLGFNRF